MSVYLNITDFGAVGDGVTNNAAAIQKAIDLCHTQGGGTVLIPAGIFKTGTIWLKSHVELHLAEGATLLASENMDDYNAFDAYPQNFSYPDEQWVGKHLIIALETENVAITGSGTIDGNGRLFYDKPEKIWRFLWPEGLSLSKDKENLRPGQLICFVECTDVKMRDVHVRNATCWCCFFHGCENVEIHGLEIKNDPTYANTDGLDIDCCRCVTVSDCTIDTGDDAIAIRGNGQLLKNTSHGCEHVKITDCVLGSSSSAVRIGVGDREIHHIRISNITVTRAATAFNLLTNYFPGCFTPLYDISFSGISLEKTYRLFEMAAWENGPIRDLSFKDVYAHTFGGSYIFSNGRFIEDLRLEDFKLIVDDIGELDDGGIEERRRSVIEIQNTECSLENVSVTGTDQTIIPWDKIIAADGCNITATNCNFDIE